jgi:hypothetical protein
MTGLLAERMVKCGQDRLTALRSAETHDSEIREQREARIYTKRTRGEAGDLTPSRLLKRGICHAESTAADEASRLGSAQKPRARSFAEFP